MLPISSGVQSWSPALGRVYQTPSTAATTSTTTKHRDATPQPDTANKPAAATNLPSSRLIEEALGIHHQFGEHHLDANPITGKPGDFQLSSTGRNGGGGGGGVNLSAAAAANLKKASLIPSLPTLNTKLGATAENPLAAKPSGKETKSPKTPGGGGGMARGKKRKGSKAAVTPQ